MFICNRIQKTFDTGVIDLCLDFSILCHVILPMFVIERHLSSIILALKTSPIARLTAAIAKVPTHFDV